MKPAKIKTWIDMKGMGGFLSVGDLDGDGQTEYVVTQGTRHLAAFDQDGALLWRKSRPEYGQVRVHVECEMPTLVYDIDDDGQAEVIARWYLEDTRDAVPFLQILDGRTGAIRRQAALPVSLWPESVNSMAHSGSLVVGRIERDRPPHLVVGGMCWGLAILDHELKVRFCNPQFGRVHDRMTGFGLCHKPCLFDVDGDGSNELFLGRTTCRADGTLLWTINPEVFSPSQIDHVDSLAVADVAGDGRFELAVSNAGTLVNAQTGEILWKHPELINHGQQVRIARVRDDMPGLQIIVGDGNRSTAHVFSAAGAVLASMPYSGLLNPLNWLGNELCQIALGPVIRDGCGKEIALMPLAEAVSKLGCRWPTGDPESWGHTMACDVDGDGLEELIWVNRMGLIVFGNPEPPPAPLGVTRDAAYWKRIANFTRY